MDGPKSCLHDEMDGIIIIIIIKPFHCFRSSAIPCKAKKPKKPVGLCSSLRPIMLLNVIRKILSAVVVARARPTFEVLLPHGQAGSRPGRSTSDGVWAKQMCIAIAAHFNVSVSSLGTDIRAAFDTVDRNKLLDFFGSKGWMRDDELRLTRLLLSNTSFCVRVDGVVSGSVTTNIAVIQGDGLSGLIFIGYLAGAMYNNQIRVFPSRPKLDMLLDLPLETSYVDDMDCYSTAADHLEAILEAIEINFASWGFSLAKDKTERTRFVIEGTEDQCAKCMRKCLKNAACCDKCDRWWHYECAALQPATVQRFMNDPSATFVCDLCISGRQPMKKGSETWRRAIHLGTLLDAALEVNAKIQRAWAAFASLSKIWSNRKLVGEKRRLRLFKAFVLPHLSYNIAVLALTPTLEKKLDVAHRRMLRKTFGIFYPKLISNEDLYHRAASEPMSSKARNARWTFLGHILRRSNTASGWRFFLAFFKAKAALNKRPGRVAWTLIDVLANDLRRTEERHGLELSSVEDCFVLKDLAEERSQWNELRAQVCEEL